MLAALPPPPRQTAAGAALKKLQESLAAARLRDEDSAALRRTLALVERQMAAQAGGQPDGQAMGVDAAGGPMLVQQIEMMDQAVAALAQVKLAMFAGRQLLNAGALEGRRRFAVAEHIRTAAAERDILLGILEDAGSPLTSLQAAVEKLSHTTGVLRACL